MSDTSTRRAPSAERPRAIVLGAYYAGLATARALAQEGIRVMVVAAHPREHACFSRFVSEVLVVRGNDLLAQLMETGPEWEGALLVPELDERVMFVSRNRDTLARRFRVGTPEWETLDRIIHKSLLYPIAQDAGVPVPDFVVPDSVDSLEPWRDRTDYPCVLKPDESHTFRNFYGDAKVLKAHGFAELVATFREVDERGLRIMVSEVIPGDDTSLYSYRCYIDSRGDVLGELCTRKLRQYPQGFGQGSLQRTVPMIPEIREHSLALLRALGYRGEAHTEYRLDARDGRYKLMETNVRPGVSEWMAVSAGVNLPYLMYRDLVEDVREPVDGYDPDVTWVHNYWEFVHLVRRVRSGHPRLGDFFEDYGRRRVYAIPFWTDPLGFLRGTAAHVAVLGARIERSGPV